MDKQWLRLTPDYKLCHSDDTSLIFCNTSVSFRRQPLPDINLILWDFLAKGGKVGRKRVYYRDPVGNYYLIALAASRVNSIKQCSFNQRTFLSALVTTYLGEQGGLLKSKGGQNDGKAIVC